MSKICFKCNKEKSLTEFYPHKQMKDGHLNKCKTCTLNDVKEYRKNSERPREYDRERYHNNPERNAYQVTQRKEWAANNREKVNRSSRESRLRHPKQRKARLEVQYAVRSGRLTKQPCEVCNNVKSHAHHCDYNKPLDVIWLCTKHHAEWHMNNEVIT